MGNCFGGSSSGGSGGGDGGRDDGRFTTDYPGPNVNQRQSRMSNNSNISGGGRNVPSIQDITGKGQGSRVTQRSTNGWSTNTESAGSRRSAQYISDRSTIRTNPIQSSTNTRHQNGRSIQGITNPRTTRSSNSSSSSSSYTRTSSTRSIASIITKSESR